MDEVGGDGGEGGRGALDLYAPPKPRPGPASAEAGAGARIAVLDLYEGLAAPASELRSQPPEEELPPWVEVVWARFPHEIRRRYRPRAVLGEGGMGVVVEARDLGMDRLVAIKGLRDPGGVSLEVLRRQAQEARLTASLTHANILPVYDQWEDRAGNPWYSMLRVAGNVPTLASRLEELADRKEVDRRPLSELLDIFLQLCRAVAYAHEQGVVHRDIKPHNVLLGPSGEAFLADWGVAVATDEVVMDQVVGTPGYSSPEQFAGAAVAPTADIYSLGVVLFELVAGRRPDDEATRIMATTGSPARGVTLEVPERVSRELTAVILRATAPDPAARYQDVREVIRALDAYLDGGLLEGLSYSPRERLAKWAQARPATAATVATGLIGAALLVGLSVREGRVQARLLARAQGNLAQAMAERAASEVALRRLDRARHLAVLGLATMSEADEPPAAAVALLEGPARRGWMVAMGELPGARLVAPGPELGLRVVAEDGVRRVAELGRPWPAPTGEAVRASVGGREALVTVGNDGVLRLWRDQEPSELSGRLPAPSAMALDSAEATLLAGGEGQRVRRWDLRTPGAAPAEVGPEGFAPLAIAFAPSERAGRVAALGGADGAVRLWDPVTRNEKAAIDGPVPVRALAFRPDGSLLASSGSRSSVRLWDVRAWKQAGSLAAHPEPVTALAFSPDGALLASGDAAGGLRVWDVSHEEVCAWLEGHVAEVRSVAFDAAGSRLYSVGAGGRVLAWDPWRCRGDAAEAIPVGGGPEQYQEFLERSLFMRQGPGLELTLRR